MPMPFIPKIDWFNHPIQSLLTILKLIKDICFVLLRGSIFSDVEEVI